MLWVNDNNKMSVHHLKYVTQPKKTWNEFKRGDNGWSRYPGAAGEWKYTILFKLPNDLIIKNPIHGLVYRRDFQSNRPQVKSASKRKSNRPQKIKIKKE